MKGVVILWPSHQDFKNTLVEEIKTSGIRIEDEAVMQVTQKYIKNILLEIHYGKEWWDTYIDSEYVKRLDQSQQDKQTLTFFVIEHAELNTMVKGFKKQTREKYSLDKSYFHMSDPDCSKCPLGQNCSCDCDKNEFTLETLRHLDLLTHSNTVDFLNKAVHRKDLNFYKYFKIYKDILNNQPHVNKSRLCIDNGGVLAAYGIRDTHDLDFLNTYNDLMCFNHEDVGCENFNHRLEYKRLGYDIKDIVEDSNNYFYHFGEKFMALRILKQFKFNRTHTIGTGHKEIRAKDVNDYNSIKDLA
tara:strand:- start:218 stop:1117 length:900 start_codon:yes stop_codon:yes gene_type:complete